MKLWNVKFAQGCANPRKFANICEFISEICEFDLREFTFFLKTRFVAITEQIQVQMYEFLLLICDFVAGSAHP